MNSQDADTTSPQDEHAPRLSRRLRAIWWLLGDHIAKWLHDQRRGRPIRVAIALGLITAPAILAVVVILGSRVSKRAPQYERLIRLPSAEDVLFAGNGLLYAGAEDGHMVAYEPIRAIKDNGTILPHPVRYMAVYGDHVFAAGEETVSRLSPSLREPITRRLTLADHAFTITGLAAGSLGVWVIDSSHRRLIRLSSQTLAPVQELRMPIPVHGLAVSADGVWALARRHVLLSKPHHGVWTTTQIRVHSEPRAIATEHDRAVVLCTMTSDLYVLIDKSGELEHLFTVARRGLGIGLDGGDLWVMSPGDDQVSEYSLQTERLENKVSIGISAAQLAVNPQALWIGETSDAVERIDKEKLAIAQTARHSVTRATLLQIPILAWGGTVAGVLIGVCSALIVIKRQTDPNAGIPRYWPPRRLLVFMINKVLFENVASAAVTTRTRTRRRGGELSTSLPVGLQGSQSSTDSRQQYPVAMHVRDTIARLEGVNLLYRGLNYVPGVPHNRMRFSAAATPKDQDFIAHFSENAGRLCLIAGSTWLVGEIEDDPGIVTFSLPELIDKTVSQSRRITIPERVRPRFRVGASTMMLPIAHDRCTPGARVALDVIVQMLPYDERNPPRLDLVVAWQATELVGAPRARERGAGSSKRRPRRQRT